MEVFHIVLIAVAAGSAVMLIREYVQNIRGARTHGASPEQTRVPHWLRASAAPAPRSMHAHRHYARHDRSPAARVG